MLLTRYHRLVLAAVCAVGLAACDDPLEPNLAPVPEEPGEATLIDVRSGSLQDPSAFDVLTARAVRTDQIAGWDFVFEISGDGPLLLWPRPAITEEGLESGLYMSELSFDGLQTAPEDGYTTSSAVAVEVGDVLAMQSRRDPSFGSIRCRRYGKMEILSVDLAESTVTFRHLINPNCEQRTLVPGAEE